MIGEAREEKPKERNKNKRRVEINWSRKRRPGEVQGEKAKPGRIKGLRRAGKGGETKGEISKGRKKRDGMGGQGRRG